MTIPNDPTIHSTVSTDHKMIKDEHHEQNLIGDAVGTLISAFTSSGKTDTTMNVNKTTDTIDDTSIAEMAEVANQTQNVATPMLPQADQSKVKEFEDNFKKDMNTLQSTKIDGTTKKGVLNKWLMVNAAVDLFVNVNFISKILTQISRKDSQLAQKISMNMISMAKEMYNLGIQAGNAKAEMHKLEAIQKFTEMGVALFKIATNVMSATLTTIRYHKNLDGNMDRATRQNVLRNAQETSNVESQIASGLGDAAASGIGAVISLRKAHETLQEALAESLKQYLGAIMQIMQQSVQKLEQDQSSISKTRENLWEMVRGSQRASADIWSR